MNDQIKDFVEQHREEFDHLEAPAFDMDRFKRMQVQPEQLKVKKLRFFNSKWLVAASVVLVAATAWLFFYPQTQVERISYSKGATATLPIRPEGKTNKASGEQNRLVQTAKVKPDQPETIKERPKYISKRDEYAALKDSSSASVRLLAILKIEKNNRINNKTLDMLSKTLNHDGNTNVRLAALNILQKYSTDKYASKLLVNSLNKQDDPMVQLGLVSFLGKMKNVEIGEKLYALANNPETFAAVRDEAYSVLLNQDKL
ncbi:HEAT repeat domain-containing protein [Pedobacter jeongneungensis]|uniref:HEAT repeat domain-containing protein n=1 Tax=Pedobacter jeongneungensis TaxID=947309 RepID=UPI000469E936|nr:HEAT repeat domain-containing protein [Pedobacter jeongneungensis]